MSVEKSIEFEDAVWAAGFTQVPNTVLLNPDLSMGARMVYAQFLHFAREAEEAYPGQTRLADDLGCSERSVRTYLSELESAGLIRIRRRGLRQTNLYTLLNPRTANIAGQAREAKSAGLDRQKETPLDRQNLPTKKTKGGRGGEQAKEPFSLTANDNSNAHRDQRVRGREYAAPVVHTVLAEVAAQRGCRAPTLKGVERALDRHPTRHALEAVDKTEFWALDGVGATEQIRSLIGIFEYHLARTQEIPHLRAVDVPNPTTDWGPWITRNLYYLEGSDHFVSAFARLTLMAFRGVGPEVGAVRAYVEDNHGPYRSAA